ncbi:MAG: hypothetical protein LLF89_06155 [Spirochaetaceae bacterium]|nr:hypothetical protein [Spirochaetaceae bacterium]
MNGTKRNTAQLFDSKGHLFVLALDHAQGGVVPGLEKTGQLLDRLAGSALDGFILNIGLADAMATPRLLRKKLVLRSSFGGSQLATDYSTVHTNHVSPETALAVGADAVLMMAVVGGTDYRSLQDMAAAIDAYHRLSIPVIAEIIAADFTQTTSPDVQLHGARIAAELGADVIKAFWTDNFDKVIESCPAPVILAGGPKDKDIVLTAGQALKAGAKGFAFGRNIFQASKPEALIDELRGLLG